MKRNRRLIQENNRSAKTDWKLTKGEIYIMFGLLLKCMREERKLTIEAMGTLSSLSESSVERAERGIESSLENFIILFGFYIQRSWSVKDLILYFQLQLLLLPVLDFSNKKTHESLFSCVVIYCFTYKQLCEACRKEIENREKICAKRKYVKQEKVL